MFECGFFIVRLVFLLLLHLPFWSAARVRKGEREGEGVSYGVWREWLGQERKECGWHGICLYAVSPLPTRSEYETRRMRVLDAAVAVFSARTVMARILEAGEGARGGSGGTVNR